MKITTWNVNSIRAREDRVLNWLDQHQPDVLCLQELKCTEEQFPFDGFDALGYSVVLHGQKSYNGVAIVSLDYPDWVEEAVPWPQDDHSRGIAAEVNGIRVVSLYCPNGREVGHEMYRYKLEWFDRLRSWLDGQDAAGELVLTGDYNITFDDRDVNDPEFWHERNLCSTPERERLNALIDWGLTDALRLFDESAGVYTWWDYRTGGVQQDKGLRIDHHLITAPLVERAVAVEIDTEERQMEGDGDKPSDHAPVTLVLED